MRFALALVLLSPSAFAATQPAPNHFPDGFKWCLATAAYQIEGDDPASDFWNWETYQQTNWDPIAVSIAAKASVDPSLLPPINLWEQVVPSRVGSHLKEINPYDTDYSPSAGGAMASKGDPCKVLPAALALTIEKDSSRCISDKEAKVVAADPLESCAGRIETDHTVKFPKFNEKKEITDYAVCEFSGKAVDHWHKVDQDIALMKQLGANTYRMSVEWAKIQPHMPKTVPSVDLEKGTVTGEDADSYDQDAIKHYQQEIAALRRAYANHPEGIEPLVTLFHFSLPEWFREKGGWENPDAPKYFAAFTKTVYEALGDKVAYWFTLNEPMVHLSAGYAAGVHPPGLTFGEGMDVHDTLKLFKTLQDNLPHLLEAEYKNAPATRLWQALKGILASHGAAYHMMHALYATEGKAKNWPEPQVGVASHLRIEDPVDGKPIQKWGFTFNSPDKDLANVVDYVWNWMFIDAIETGELRFFEALPGEKIPYLERTEDFAGINYYSRDMIAVGAASAGVNPGTPKNDLGWEIYPEGFTRILRHLNQRVIKDRGGDPSNPNDQAKALPLLVSENGVADRVAPAPAPDPMRESFLKTHLTAMMRAMQPQTGDTGEWDYGNSPALPVNVIGYCHWAMTGNFEWNSGFNPDFGLSAVDMRASITDSMGNPIPNPDYLSRKIRSSAHVFTDAATTNALSY